MDKADRQMYIYIAAKGEEIFVQPTTRLETYSDSDSDTDKENTF